MDIFPCILPWLSACAVDSVRQNVQNFRYIHVPQASMQRTLPHPAIELRNKPMFDVPMSPQLPMQRILPQSYNRAWEQAYV